MVLTTIKIEQRIRFGAFLTSNVLETWKSFASPSENNQEWKL